MIEQKHGGRLLDWSNPEERKRILAGRKAATVKGNRMRGFLHEIRRCGEIPVSLTGPDGRLIHDASLYTAVGLAMFKKAVDGDVPAARWLAEVCGELKGSGEDAMEAAQRIVAVSVEEAGALAAVGGLPDSQPQEEEEEGEWE